MRWDWCMHMSGNTGTFRLAVLIDGDNAEAKLLGSIMDEASKHGTATVRRVYGDWTTPGMTPWRKVANTYAFQTPHQLHYTTGKNATDSFLIIEAMELLYSDHVDGFCIVSSDSDFTGLAKQIREHGMFVMGIGRSTTPESFQKACAVFTHTEILAKMQEVAAGMPQVGAGTKKSPDMKDAARSDNVVNPDSGEAHQTPDWKRMMRKAIDMASQEEWARLADVGNNLRKIDPSFDTRAYGSKTLLALVTTALDEFEIREETRDGSLPVHHVRVITAKT